MYIEKPLNKIHFLILPLPSKQTKQHKQMENIKTEGGARAGGKLIYRI